MSSFLLSVPQSTQALDTRLKHRIIDKYFEGESYRSIARELGICDYSVRKFVNIYLDTGDILTPKQIQQKLYPNGIPYNRLTTKLSIVEYGIEDVVLQQLCKCNTTTLEKYVEVIRDVTSIELRPGAVWNYLKQNKITYKVCSKAATNVNYYLVDLYFRDVKRYMSHFNQMVFLDEIGFSNCTSNKTRGRAKRGCKAIAEVQFLKGFKLTWICACTYTGVFTSMLVEGSCDGDIFEYFVITKLFPSMNPFPGPNSILVMDNVPFHHIQSIKDEAARLGIIILFTPPYYPNASLAELFGNAVKQKMISRRVFGKWDMVNAILTYPYELDGDWSGVLWKMGYQM